MMTTGDESERQARQQHQQEQQQQASSSGPSGAQLGSDSSSPGRDRKPTYTAEASQGYSSNNAAESSAAATRGDAEESRSGTPGGGNGGGAGAGGGTTGNKRVGGRPNVASACAPCKKAHLACDDSRPCKRCSNMGKEDQCEDVPVSMTSRQSYCFPADLSAQEEGTAQGQQDSKRHAIPAHPPSSWNSSRFHA